MLFMLNLLNEKFPQKYTQKYLLLDSLSQRLVTESQTVHFTPHWFNLMMNMMIPAQMIQTQCLETEPKAWHGSTVSSVTCHVSRTLFFTFISSAFNPVQKRVHLICTWIDNVPIFYTVILFIFHFIYFMIRLQLIHFHSQSPSLLFSPSVTNASSAITDVSNWQSSFILSPLNSPENRAVVVVLHRVISVVVLDALGEAEVSDLHRALVLHQHISGCQVSVDVIFRSQIVHPLRKKNKHTVRVSIYTSCAWAFYLKSEMSSCCPVLLWCISFSLKYLQSLVKKTATHIKFIIVRSDH